MAIESVIVQPPGYFVIKNFMAVIMLQSNIRKDLLSRINQVDYQNSLCTTQENCNYLQLI